MKKIKYILLFVITIFCFNTDILAIDYSGGSGYNSGVLGEGGWSSDYVGVRVTVLHKSGSSIISEESAIFLNSSGKKGTLSETNKSKITGNGVISWGDSDDNYKVIINGKNVLPDNWDGVNLYNILSDNNYEKLKHIINSKKNDSSNIFHINPGDYIVVEPMLYISGFYGTAYELLHSFYDPNTDCESQTFCGPHDAELFVGYQFKNDGALIWKTLFLQNDVPELSATTYDYARTNTDFVKERLECLLNNTCGRGMGIFKYEDLYPKGYLKINKKRQGTTNHVWATAEFTVYKGSGCSGNVVESKSTSSGEVTFTLTPGSYSYRETKEPEKYIKDDACYNVSITSGSTVEKTVYNTPTCGLELEEAKKRVEPYLINILAANLTPYYSALAKELFILYEKYPTYNGLLNITDPSCEAVSCKPTASSFVSSCLSADTKNDDKIAFNKYNLSCYDTKLTNGVNTIGFCKNSVNLINNLAFIETSISDLWNKSGTRTFYSKSGSFLIRKIPWNEFPIIGELADKDDHGLIAYDYDKGKYVGELTPYIATATIEKTCYAFEGNNIDNEVKKLPTFNVYFGDNNDNGEAEKLDYDVKTNNQINTVTESISDAIRGFLNSLGINYYSIVEKSYTEVRNYKLNKVYVEKVSGKISTDPEKFDYFNEEVGIVTKFEDEATTELKKDGKLYKQGIIPFSIKYNGKTYDSDSCKYISEQEFIKNDKLNIEFRLIDTENPFNRDTNT